MSVISRAAVRFLFCGAILFSTLVPNGSAAPKAKPSQTVRGLAYDVKTKKLYFCDRISTCSVPFDPGAHFFRTGDVLVLRVLRAKLLTQYSVQVDKVAVAEYTPVIRGMDDAAPGSAITQSGKGSVDDITKNGIEPMSLADYRTLSAKDLGDRLADMQTKMRAIDDIEVKTLLSLPKSPVALKTIPGNSLSDMLTFAADLKKDIDAALNQNPYKDADGFDALAQRTDALGKAVKALKPDDPNVATLAEASRQWRIYAHNLNEANKLDSAKTPSVAGQLNPISRSNDADIYEMQAPIFDGMNRLFLQAEQTEPVDISLGTFDANYQVFFHLYEKSSFTPYSFQTADAASQTQNAQNKQGASGGGINPDQPAPGAGGAAGAAGGAGAKAGAGAAAGGGKGGASNPTGGNQSTPSDQSKSADLGKDICDKWFTVHKIYHANLIGGYAVSFLKDRSFDLKDAPSASGSQSTQKQIVQTNNSGVQTHYLVGLSYYLSGPADMFPGHVPVVRPAILIGATPDSAINFFVGMNLETKIGIDVAGGFQLGQVTSLQQGYQVGDMTSATSAPTRTSPHGAAFLSVGFDYKVFLGLFNKVSGVKTAGAPAQGAGKQP